MNKEQALKAMNDMRVCHPLWNTWYTKCHNGKYYNKKGETLDEEEMKRKFNSIPDSSNNFFEFGPKDRACS